MDLQLSSAVTLSPGTSSPARAGGDWRRGTRWWPLLLLAPALLYLIVMSIYPTIWSLWLAFHNYLVYQPDKASFAGFDNFTDLLDSEVFRAEFPCHTGVFRHRRLDRMRAWARDRRAARPQDARRQPAADSVDRSGDDFAGRHGANLPLHLRSDLRSVDLPHAERRSADC